jgi:dihydroorotate dehydrogenase
MDTRAYEITSQRHRERAQALVQLVEAKIPRGALPEDLQRLCTDLPSLSPEGREHLSRELQAFLFLGGRLDLLAEAGVPHPYNTRESLAANEEPWDARPLSSDGVDPGPRWPLLGYEVGYPIGVPACPLSANAKWVAYLGAHAYNVITYKTVRTNEWLVEPPPHWAFAENGSDPLPPGVDLLTLAEVDPNSPGDFRASDDLYPRELRAYSMANSFGVPSPPAERWTADVADARRSLGDGKLLIVSVMGSGDSRDLVDHQDVIADFANAAQMAKDAGAHAIELNMSCPNTVDYGANVVVPPIYMKAEYLRDIVLAAAERLQDEVPLVVKLGYLPYSDMERTVGLIADHVDAIAGINTVQADVRDAEGRRPFFEGTRDDEGADRNPAGVSGFALRHLALDFALSLRRLKQRHSWDFDVIAAGGVMDPHDVWTLMAAGADAVQSASATETNMALARDVLQPYLDGVAGTRSWIERLAAAVFDEDCNLRSLDEVAEALDVDPQQIQDGARSEYDIPRRVSELIVPDIARTVDAAKRRDPWLAGPEADPATIERIEHLRRSRS